MDHFFYCPHNKYALTEEQCRNRRINKKELDSWRFCKRCKHRPFPEKVKLKRRKLRLKLRRRKIK